MPTHSHSPGTGLFARFFAAHPPVTVTTPGASQAQLDRCARDLGADLPAALQELLAAQNGGYYRDGLLHLLGAGRPLRHDDLASWNDPALWKAQYRMPELEGLLFFADDPFGNQFGIRLKEPVPAVWRFDIQYGELDRMADSLPDFLNHTLVQDGDWLLGADFLQAYRQSGAPWVPGYHVAMRSPSLLGGATVPENLVPQEPWVHLYLTGQIVAQVKPLPAGVPIAGIRIDPATLSVIVEPGRR